MELLLLVTGRAVARGGPGRAEPDLGRFAPVLAPTLYAILFLYMTMT